MTLIIPPGFGSAAIEFEGAAGTPSHITTIGIDLSAVGGDFVAAANNVMQAYGRAFKARTANSLTIQRVTLAVGSDGPGGSVVSSVNPIAGTLAGTFEAIAMAPIARKVTNELGRRGRGRMFLPGVLPSNWADQNGNISSPNRALLQDACNAFMSGLELGTESPGAGEIETPPTPPVLLHSAVPSTPTVIVDLAVQSTVGWIRGRIR